MKPYALSREEGEAIWMFHALDTRVLVRDRGQRDRGFTWDVGLRTSEYRARVAM
jgi:hypothetical protein